MITKLLTFGVIVLVVLLILGRIRLPGRGRQGLTTRICPACGCPIPGKGPCPCGQA